MQKRTIIFDNSLGRFSPDEAFILSDEGLMLTLYGLPTVITDRESYYLTLQNDAGETRTHRIRGNDLTFEVDAEFLLPGELRGSVLRKIDITTVKTWEIEPLTLARIESDIVASPVIAALEKKVAELAQSLASFSDEMLAQIRSLKASVGEKLSSEIKAVITATDENAANLDGKIKAVADIVKNYMKSAPAKKKK